MPLNISRETLQENVIFNKISNNVTNQVLSYLQKKAKDEPEKYNDFWNEHGRIFKLGYSDFTNLEKYSQLLRFNSSSCKDNKELISLEDYVSRLKDNQKEIYFAFGSSRDAIDLDPHLEVFKRKGLEVLYMYDPIDEFVVTSIRKFKDYDFKSVDTVELDKIEKLKDEKETETKAEELSKDDTKQFDSLLAKMKTILGDRVVDVKESKRLFDSPSCLVNPDNYNVFLNAKDDAAC